MAPETVFTQYRRKQIAELRPYEDGESLRGVSISDVDRDAGSPKAGDMVARNPHNHADQWLVAAKYFAENFEPIIPTAPRNRVDHGTHNFDHGPCACGARQEEVEDNVRGKDCPEAVSKP